MNLAEEQLAMRDRIRLERANKHHSDENADKVAEIIKKSNLLIDDLDEEMLIKALNNYAKMNRGLNERYTYFIKSEKLGFIKIGLASNIYKRFQSLQNSTPDTLILLGYLEGNCELMLHRKFRKHIFKGEWFNPNQELLDFIDKHTIKVKK